MALRETLRRLCFETGWCYAVFWKLKRRSRMVLTWEDGYYEHSCPAKPTLQRANDGSVGVSRNSLDQGGSQEAGYLNGRIELAVAKMSYSVHFMGEGVIGRVAFTGKHQWVFRDGDMCRRGETPAGEYPAGWEAQFSAGIKSIAVIAVPLGVVQLGSTQVVMEDMNWVSHVKSAFGILQNVPGAFLLDGFSDEKASTSLSSVPKKHVKELGGAASFGKSFSNVPGHEKDTESQNAAVLRAFKDSWKEAKHQRAQLVATSEACSDVPQSLTLLVPSQPNFPQAKAHHKGIDDTKSQMHSTLGLASLIGTNMAIDYGSMPGNIPSLKVKYAQEGGVVSVNDLLDVRRAGSLMPLPINESSQLQLPPAHLNARAVPVKVTGITPSLSQTSQSFSNNRTMKDDARNMAYSFSSISGEEGSAAPWGTSLNDSHADLSDGMCAISGKELLCPTVNYTALEAEKCMAEIDAKLGSKDLELDRVEYTDEFGDKHLASLSSEQPRKWNSTFAIGDELSQALVPASGHTKEKGFWEEMLPKLGAGSPRQTLPGMPSWGFGQPILETKSEALLEAVVATSSVTTGGDSYSSKASMLHGSKEATDSNPHSLCTSLPQCFALSAPSFAGPLSMSTVNSAGYHSSFTSDPSFREILNTFEEDMRSMKSNSTQASQSRKPEQLAKIGRKRARPGENARPRPKDRQQIQDRVRELREIVPNGSKCSIDALLEKTINHMLFLQNVMQHADKLKNSGKFKDDMESGASWALDVGGDELGCPILVKNLSQPRQMVIEMFCEENDHSLEIADVVRSLGLTILKGVIESRVDKIWARFIVEANKDVHRVDIMMSLMQLLHVNSNSSVSSMTLANQANQPMQS